MAVDARAGVPTGLFRMVNAHGYYVISPIIQIRGKIHFKWSISVTMIRYFSSVDIDRRFMIYAIENQTHLLAFVWCRYLKSLAVPAYATIQIAAFGSCLFIEIKSCAPIMRKLDWLIPWIHRLRIRFIWGGHIPQTELPVEIKILTYTLSCLD